MHTTWRNCAAEPAVLSNLPLGQLVSSAPPDVPLLQAQPPSDVSPSARLSPCCYSQPTHAAPPPQSLTSSCIQKQFQALVKAVCYMWTIEAAPVIPEAQQQQCMPHAASAQHSRWCSSNPDGVSTNKSLEHHQFCCSNGCKPSRK
jgi:hypothetical protein